jgi:hypothetical protein
MIKYYYSSWIKLNNRFKILKANILLLKIYQINVIKSQVNLNFLIKLIKLNNFCNNMKKNWIISMK